MNIVRIFTGPDNQSHFEELDVPLQRGRYGELSDFLPVSRVRLRSTPAGGFADFHPAPERQLVITLDGIVEVECGDGTKRRFGPGDIMLADDTSGQGHITREIEAPRRSVFLPLPQDFDLRAWRP